MRCYEYKVGDVLVTKYGFGCVEEIIELRNCAPMYQLLMDMSDIDGRKRRYVFPTEIKFKIPFFDEE